MGNGQSEPCIDRFLRGVKEAPNMRVSLTITDYCSLESSDNLRRHYEKRKMEMGDGAAEWVKSLAEKLACFAPDSNMAGLGALVVAILIDSATFSPPEDATEDALRCVFAEEKASEVWVHISDCLRRCVMNHTDNNMLKKDLEHIERQLCTALSRLLRSIVADKYMTADAIKAWVNGAAFHIQMLIHLVRLGGYPTSNTVERLIASYQSDLDRMISNHKDMIKSECKKVRDHSFNGLYSKPCLVDENSKKHVFCFCCSEDVTSTRFKPCMTYEAVFEEYYDCKFGRQMQDIKGDFRYVRENLQSLLHQRGFLDLEV